MTEKAFRDIVQVLKEHYHYDELDIVEFVLYYEKFSGEKIPDKWINGN